MTRTQLLKEEIEQVPKGEFAYYYYQYLGYKKNFAAPNVIARANATAAVFEKTEPFIYKNDLIVGSINSVWSDADEDVLKDAMSVFDSFGMRDFYENRDHFSPDYDRITAVGISGLLSEIEMSEIKHKDEPKRLEYLSAMKITVLAFRSMILNYASAAEFMATQQTDKSYSIALLKAAENCRAVAYSAPQTFEQGLQLIWLCHTAFNYEGAYAMALGRIDQYLYPLYLRDKEEGRITHEYAVELFENVFIKIYECRAKRHFDDVVNICIGGTNEHGESDVNELSFCVLEAVRNCNVPGPNLSARVASNTPDEFLDACLKVIGTGLGYPALMNDDVNIPALARMGYEKKHTYNYTMVGCIENFMTGMQPPWSDTRFDVPRFFEFMFNRGRGIVNSGFGIDQGEISSITCMDEFMKRFEEQVTYGADLHFMMARNKIERLNPESYSMPFMSCFCYDCIGTARDINNRGSYYPLAIGADMMGVGTVSDSLAAIEKVIFEDKAATLDELADAIHANFAGYESLRELLLAAPKYGNNNNYVDKYAVWFVDFLASVFDRYRNYDGGRYYISMSSNIGNVDSGLQIAATPDGRLAGEPISDAASPTYGRDVKGATSTVISITKPDYTKVATGTVINQKFSPAMFEDGKREKLLTLIKTYIALGGQQIQINATSRDVLLDAMAHPENYRDLVVRVSGFSAFFIHLTKEVQMDILNRTQQA